MEFVGGTGAVEFVGGTGAVELEMGMGPTVTVRVRVSAALPELSAASYRMVYVPGTAASTVPDTLTLPVMSPS